MDGDSSYIPVVLQSNAQFGLLAASSLAPSPHWVYQPQCDSNQITASHVLRQSTTSPSAVPSSSEDANNLNDLSPEEIRPSRPRELPRATLLVDPPAGVATTQTVRPSPEQRALCFDSYSTINDYANSFYACSGSGSSDNTAPPPIVPIHQPVHETQLSSYSELSANLGFLTPILQNQNPTPATCDVHMDYVATLPSRQIYHYEPNSDCVTDRSNELAWIDVWPSDATASPFLWPAAAMSYATMAAQTYDLLQAEAVDAVYAQPPPPSVQIEHDPSEKLQSTPKALDAAEPVPSLPPSSPKPRSRKPKVRTPPRDSTPRPASEELKRLNEPKMACLFCRERKIACGALKRGNENKNCDQCSKRGLQCVFPRPRRRVSAKGLNRPHSCSNSVPHHT